MTVTKSKQIERRLIVVSKRRQPTDEGLARLVAAMVLHQIEQQNVENAAVATTENSA